MTYQKIAIFDDKKVIQQVYVLDSNQQNIWLQANPELSNNYEILEEHSEVGVGWSWNKTKKTWISPAPYPNWILDEENKWIPPLPKPTDEPKGDWYWHQDENMWKDIVHIPLEEQ